MTDKSEKQCLFFAAFKNTQIARVLIGIMVITLCLWAGLATPDISYAGEMNGAESGIYGAASGTFEYNGKLYRAYDEYLSQLAGYLCRDDVNLDESQASAAISKMYANVGAGVAQGYLYQVGQVEDDKQEYFRDNEKEEKPMKDEDEYLKSKLYLENQEKIDSQNALLLEDNKRARKERAKNLKDAQDAFANTLAKRPNIWADGQGVSGDGAQGSSTQGNQQINGQAQDKIGGLVNQKTIDFCAGVTLGIGIGSLVIILVVAILLFGNKCFAFQKKKKHHGHHKRKKIRKISAGVLIAVVAINGAVGLGALGYRLGFTTYEGVKTGIDASGIYHIHYEELMGAIQDNLEEYNLSARLCDQIVTYSDFQFDCEKSTKAQLKGKSAKSTHSGVEEKIAMQMENVAYLQEKDAEKFAEEIIQIYREKTQLEIGPAIYEMRRQVKKGFAAGASMCVVNGLCALVLLVIGQRRLKRGFGIGFFGALAAWAAFGAIVAFVMISKCYENLAIANDELYVFAVNWAAYGAKAMLQTLAGAGIFAMLLGIVAKFMPERD